MLNLFAGVQFNNYHFKNIWGALRHAAAPATLQGSLIARPAAWAAVQASGLPFRIAAPQVIAGILPAKS